MKALAAAFLLTGLAAPAAAQEFPEGKWWKRPRIAAAIDLTAEQTRAIEGIFTRSRPRLIDLKADLEKKQGELQDALEDEKSDRGAVAARVEAVENARAELQKARVLMVFDMKQVVKPEQWERLVRMQQEMRRQRMERMDRFREQERRRPFDGERPQGTRPNRRP